MSFSEFCKLNKTFKYFELLSCFAFINYWSALSVTMDIAIVIFSSENITII